MRHDSISETCCRAVLALAAALFLGGLVQAQASLNVPDAQVEANVLNALAGAPQLASESITTNTVYGTVTLSGSVKDEPARQLAEALASKAPGVKKVVDELTLGVSTASGEAGVGTNPMLQSDGTMAPAPVEHPGGAQQHAPDPDTYPAQHGIPQDDGQGGQPPLPDGSGGGMVPKGNRQPYTGPAPGASKPPDYGQGQQPYDRQQPPYPASQPYPVGGPRGGRDRNPPPPYVAQVAGQPVTVPSGALLRIRINEGLDSKHSQPGTPFDAVVLNDVVADGAVAIPRGASVEGTVTEAKSGGVFAGHGELALKLTQVTLSGKTFPISSDVWSRDSSDKAGQTINNAVGLGAAGAIIGAIAGGGAGAAIGAGVGGVAGVGTSAASGSRQVLIPSEAILTFHLAQPAALTTISQAEMDRLSYGVPVGAQGSPQMWRRPYPQPYYGPVYYPRPYPYPY